jgi:hypothetical protein
MRLMLFRPDAVHLSKRPALTALLVESHSRDILSDSVINVPLVAASSFAFTTFRPGASLMLICIP